MPISRRTKIVHVQPKWEYMRLDDWEEVQRAGREGWELVAVDADWWYLKRRVFDKEVSNG